jgi:hypothetical protein
MIGVPDIDTGATKEMLAQLEAIVTEQQMRWSAVHDLFAACLHEAKLKQAPALEAVSHELLAVYRDAAVMHRLAFDAFKARIEQLDAEATAKLVELTSKALALQGVRSDRT